MHRKTNTDYNSYPHICVCCNEGVVSDQYDICLVCGWEDDEVQNFDENFEGGANKKSLVEHRRDFIELRQKNKKYQWSDKLR